MLLWRFLSSFLLVAGFAQDVETIESFSSCPSFESNGSSYYKN
jgi:hypothetical protein